MALRLEDKQAIVAEVAAVAQRARSAIAAEYRGLTVSEITELRVKARENRIYLRVVKNTLAKRAVSDTPFSCLQEGLQGPLVLAFAEEDPGAVARLFRDFAKAHDNLRPKLVAVEGQLLDASGLDRLANLPTREQALGLLMGVMKAPIAQLVRTLAEPHAKLARTVAAIRDCKQVAQ